MEQHVYMFTTVACVSYEKKAWTVVVGQQFHRASNTSHLKPLNTKRPRYMAMEIQVLAWDTHKMLREKLVNWIPFFPLW